MVAYALRDDVIIAQSYGDTEAAARAGLVCETDIILRIGSGTPDAVPCRVLPKQGTRLPVLTQDQPPDILGAWVRVWIAGFLAQNPNWDGVVCTVEADVSHWVHISADEIISFQSFLTPRLVSALKGASMPEPEALANTMTRPERLAAHLRQAEVAGNAAAITGHLIGAELAAARPYWLGQQVALITPGGDASGYGIALRAQGVPVATLLPEDVLPDGLAALGHALGLVT